MRGPGLALVHRRGRTDPGRAGPRGGLRGRRGERPGRGGRGELLRPRGGGDAVELAVAVTGKPAVVYPNSGERWDARARGWSGDMAFDPERALAWAGAGARLVGGCCRVGPETVGALAGTLAAKSGDGTG
ncbi:homocysteine S-methyltransferase family protein [Streptomyces venezuelae ATCC 10712]